MYQFVKYVLVGSVNFIISMGIFLFLLKVLVLNYLISFTTTWLLGILLTYIINFLWVFKAEDKLEFKKRMPKYFFVYLISYLINLLLLALVVDLYSFDPFWAQFFILPIVVCINFFGFKHWALKRYEGKQ